MESRLTRLEAVVHGNGALTIVETERRCHLSAHPYGGRGSILICDEFRSIFVHVPKTAGQSIEQVFIDRLGLTWDTRSKLLLRRSRSPDEGPPALAHLFASEYVSNGHISQSQFDQYFKFTFVRNPWDRLVSEYRYRRFERQYGFETFDFEEFLFDRFPEAGWSDLYRHTVPQYKYIFDQHDTQLVDFVGRYECLEADFQYVTTKLGMGDVQLPRRNSIPFGAILPERRRRQSFQFEQTEVSDGPFCDTSPRYTNYYSKRTWQFVADLYSRDIDLFGYSHLLRPTLE